MLLIITLNEWGGFLAGVTAPLAFLWLIIGLQRKELNANTEALLFQRNELASQAKELGTSPAFFTTGFAILVAKTLQPSSRLRGRYIFQLNFDLIRLVGHS